MTRHQLARLFVTVFLAAAWGPGIPSAHAQEKPREEQGSAKALPDFDVRTRAARPAAALAVADGGPEAALAQRLATMVDAAGEPVRYSLSADGWPKTVSSVAGLTRPSADGPESIARSYLTASGGVSPLLADDVSALRLRQASSAGSLRVLYFQQYAGETPVYGSSVKIAVNGEGRVRLAAFADPAPGVQLLSAEPALSAAQAVRLALESLQIEMGGLLESLPASNGRLLFGHPEGGGRLPVAAELVAFPMAGGQARLAWRVLADAGRGSYEVLIAADDGQALLRHSLVAEAGSGRVFAVSPLKPSAILPFGEGWLGAGSTVTTGNNVDAYADFDGNDQPDNFETPGLSGGRASSATQTFDFDPGAGANAGRATRAAAVTNAFYHSNHAHDFFYGLGFRETEGNFQQDNAGRGGLGQDAVLVEVHDALVANNARFVARPDGLAPRLELGLATRTPGAVKDYAFDGPIVVHEYTHGVTTRAVGGPDSVSCVSGTQPGALGEGWSDYFGASLYDAPVIGDYISGDLVNGVRGVATDRNTRTYADLGAPAFEVHHDGAMWAAILWDIRKAIGAGAADALILRGIQVTACNPTYVDARDAILAADDGGRRAQLWTIFAARGLGFGASAFNASAAAATVFNSNFDLPPDLAPGNRAPQITSRPLAPASFGSPYRYLVRSVDLDGDARSYELVSGPAGVQVDAASGAMTWASPAFAAHRIQIAVTDGKGGRTVHGFELRVEAELAPGQPITISAVSGSFGLAFLTVPPNTEILQLRLRGDNGEADLLLLSPGVVTDFSFLRGSNETLSIRNPAPGEWVAAVDGVRAYRDLSLTGDLLTATAISAPGEVSGLSEEESGELFYKVTVPPATPLLRVTLTGTGDADLLLARGRVPICAMAPVSLPCDEDETSGASGSYERLSIANPEPGDYFITAYAFDAFQDVALRVAFTAPAALPNAATDGAAFQLINAPGGIASLFGTGLAEATVSAGSLPLPKELGGVRVIVGGAPASLFFVSPAQINFQFPIGIAAGTSTNVYVTRNGELSDPVRASYRVAAPQVFVDSATKLPVLVHADGSLVTPESPARPGETVVAYFTGIGLVNDPPADGEAAVAEPLSRTLFTARASLGGAELAVPFAGLTPGLVGLSQANLVLPATLPAGSTLPLILSIDAGFARYSSAPVNVPVAP